MARPTELGEMFHILQAVQPDLAQAPTHMVAITTTQQVTDDPRRRAYTSPRLVTWPPAPTDSPGGETETVITKTVDTATRRYRTTIWSGDRTCVVLRWRTEILTMPGLAVLHDVSWMADGLPPHTGESWQLNTLIRENYPTPSIELVSNPNSGGQGPWIEPIIGHTIYVGEVIHYLADTVNAVHESCVSPVDFFSGPVPNPQQDHGGGEHRPAHYHRFRHYQRYELHHQNHPNLHRYDLWEYVPIEINAINRPFVHYAAAIMHCINPISGGWDQLYVRDLSTGVQRQITPYFDPGDPDRMLARDFCISGTIDNFVGGPPLPSDVPSGYACVIRRNSVTDFCLAWVVKLQDTDSDDNTQTSLSSHLPNTLELLSNRGNAFPFGPGTQVQTFNSFQTWSKTDTKRPAGWIGYPVWLYTGVFADVAAVLTAAFNDGLFDLPARSQLPYDVVTGTGFTGVTGVEGPTLEAIR